MAFRARFVLAAACLILAASARAGWFDRFRAPKTSPPPKSNAVPASAALPSAPETALYDEVVDALTQRYADPSLVSRSRVAQDALQGLLASLGPSARLLDKTNAVPVRATSASLGATAVLDPFLGYVRLACVAPGAGRLLRAEIERQLKDEHIQGFLLDLRFASGAAWAELPDLAGVFLPGGRVAVRVARGAVTETIETPRSGAPVDVPLVVLVNRATSGVAELLAAVLQDQHRAVVFGSAPSAGDAFETSDVSLANGKILRLASGKFILPEAGPFFLRGVKPDVTIAFDAKIEQDIFAQPFRAPEIPAEPRYYSEAILTGREVAPPVRDPKAAKPKDEPAIQCDLVLLQAMDLLTSIHALHLAPPPPPAAP